MLASGGGLHGNRYRARRREAHTTKGNTSRYRADPNRGYPRVTGAMGYSEGVLMTKIFRGHTHQWVRFTALEQYFPSHDREVWVCVLCQEVIVSTTPDYEAGRH